MLCHVFPNTHSRRVNNKINHIHERALRIVYKDFLTSFEGLLAKNKSVTIHDGIFKVKTFKVKMGNSPIIMKKVFNFSDNNNCNLRSSTRLSRPIVHITITKHLVHCKSCSKKYGNWHREILKKKRLSIVLKTRLKNG